MINTYINKLVWIRYHSWKNFFVDLVHIGKTRIKMFNKGQIFIMLECRIWQNKK